MAADQGSSSSSTAPDDAKGQEDSKQQQRKKRVSKACESCRAKKSRCNGENPCSLCSAQGGKCVFRETKKPVNRPIPEGYVEMLESHHAQLVQGVQKLHRQVLDGDPWPGSPLDESQHGVPLTHDILDRLGVLRRPSPDPRPPAGGATAPRRRSTADIAPTVANSASKHHRRSRPKQQQTHKRRDEGRGSSSSSSAVPTPASYTTAASSGASDVFLSPTSEYGPVRRSTIRQSGGAAQSSRARIQQQQLSRSMTAPELYVAGGGMARSNDRSVTPGGGWKLGDFVSVEGESDDDDEEEEEEAADASVEAMYQSFLDFDSVASHIYGLRREPSSERRGSADDGIERVYTL